MCEKRKPGQRTISGKRILRERRRAASSLVPRARPGKRRAADREGRGKGTQRKGKACSRGHSKDCMYGEEELATEGIQGGR